MIETLFLTVFAAGALAGGLAMLVLRHPMRVALALIGTMISLAAIYATLEMHVIAVFQVLIYVGAVMVFMVYAIMLLDVRDRSFTQRFSAWLIPGLAGVAVLVAGLLYGLLRRDRGGAAVTATDAFGIQPFSRVFLQDYWLYFELASVLLLAAVVAAVAVLRAGARRDG